MAWRPGEMAGGGVSVWRNGGWPGVMKSAYRRRRKLNNEEMAEMALLKIEMSEKKINEISKINESNQWRK
jgi:hypothetical protein